MAYFSVNQQYAGAAVTEDVTADLMTTFWEPWVLAGVLNGITRQPTFLRCKLLMIFVQAVRTTRLRHCMHQKLVAVDVEPLQNMRGCLVWHHAKVIGSAGHVDCFEDHTWRCKQVIVH